jgi:hypothetical protein
MTMGPWGLHYERTNTWWEQSGAWHTYLARCQYLLRQGHFVADILYLQPELPPQSFNVYPQDEYNWDECSRELVMNRLSVSEGKLVLATNNLVTNNDSRMSYRLLALPDSRIMTPQLLSKIRDLVAAGATVVGPSPLRSPSLSGYPECDQEVQRLSAELWGDCNGSTVQEHAFGKGRVVWGIPPAKVLAQAGVPSDFDSQRKLNWIHRATGEADLFFVCNPKPAVVSTVASFRVTGRIPELWSPESGFITEAPLYEEQEGCTHVMLTLAPGESVFVVFRTPVKPVDQLVSVKQNGQPLFSTSGNPAFRIQIIQAQYGILEDPALTRDRTTMVQNLIDTGNESFLVNRMAEKEDPAILQVKTLQVTYGIMGKQFTVHARDGQTINFPENPAQVEVTRAVYGILSDPSRTLDVKKKLQQLFDAGYIDFPLTQMASGGDPAFLQIKTLIFDYIKEGQTHTFQGTDFDLVVLDTLPDTTRIPISLHKDPDGTTCLLAWSPGEYEMSTLSGKNKTVTVPALPQDTDLSTGWEVTFNPEWGLTTPLQLQALLPLNQSPEPLVQYYSGPAVYRKTVSLPETDLMGKQPLMLDLGQVEVMAEVRINGQDLGVFWKAPYQVDVTSVMKAGDNILEITVTNLWPNRMIGDEQLPEDSDRNPNGTLKAWPDWLLAGQPSQSVESGPSIGNASAGSVLPGGLSGRKTFTTWRLWNKSEALLPSGLIGPVFLKTGYQVVLDE